MPTPAKTPGTPVPGLPTADLPGVAAFKPGYWNGEWFPPAFVRQLYDNYRKFAAPGPDGNPWYVPYVSINHDRFPHLAGFRFGSLENASLSPDGALSLDAMRVPEEVAKLVATGMLAHPSVEFVRPKRDPSGNLVSGFVGPDGRIVDGPVIKCLTFLGDDMPGVKGSEPLPTPVYSDPVPAVTAFRFRGATTSRFGETTMQSREEMLTALQAMGLDTSKITDVVPDDVLAAILAFAQQLSGAATPSPATGDAANPAATVGAGTGMADVTATGGAGGITMPSVSGTGPAGTPPSQVVLKFNQQFPGLMGSLLGQLTTAAQRATAASAIADRTIAKDKERVIETLFRECDVDGTGQITVAMRPVIRAQLLKCDHVSVRKFADGKEQGTELEEACRQIKDTYPKQVKQTGRSVVLPSANAPPAGSGTTVLSVERRNRILSGSPAGQAALKRLNAAK